MAITLDRWTNWVSHSFTFTPWLQTLVWSETLKPEQRLCESNFSHSVIKRPFIHVLEFPEHHSRLWCYKNNLLCHLIPFPPGMGNRTCHHSPAGKRQDTAVTEILTIALGVFQVYRKFIVQYFRVFEVFGENIPKETDKQWDL